MTGRPFIKMHGLGNDFVVIDARTHALTLTGEQAAAICDRHTGVGCDQLLILETPADGRADLFLRIYNPDGSESGACGNGTRCVAHVVMTERGVDRLRIETRAGVLPAIRRDDGLIAVDMGPARFKWDEIPLSRAEDTDRLPLAVGDLREPVAVNMGNPHAVFFVKDVNGIDLAEIGLGLEYHHLFPERANIEIAQALGPNRLRLRVWERGVGITRACGSGACAATVAAARRGLIAGRHAVVVLDGGELEIEWREDGHVIMAGPVAMSFSGVLDECLLR